MARKSRKTASAAGAAEFTEHQAVYRTALYVRLSRERAETIERDTIGNQIAYLKSYVERHDDLEIHDLYVDDSVTGTVLERPEFDRMMADMRGGKFDAILVKDLSRMARDYIEFGNLLERVFPVLHIRFIAVNDGYDSLHSDMNLSIPVTNIANTLYAVDISQKIRAAKEQNKRDGVPLSIIPYGYKSENQGKSRIMVEDKEPADIVRRVFAMYLSGTKKMEIAKQFNQEGIPTPYQYRNRFRPGVLADKPHLAWTLNNVDRILNNEVYTGKYVIGKSTSDLSRHIRGAKVPEEDRYVFENHHVPLVSREDFELAQSLKKEDRRKKSGHINLLKGKIFCGCCGDSCSNIASAGYYYFRCTRKNRYGAQSCESKWIREERVYDTVLQTLRDQIALLTGQEELNKKLMKSSAVSRQRKTYEDALCRNKKAAQSVIERKGRLYDDLKENLVDADLFRMLQDEYTGKLRELAAEKEEIERSLERITIRTRKQGAGEALAQYMRKRKLTKEMVDALVEKVIVHGDKSLEIQLSFEDRLRESAEVQGILEAVNG